MMIKIIFIFFLFLNVSCAQSPAEDNLALGKKYSLSEEPNYQLTYGDDKKDLTDGEKKTGRLFWREKSSVGWRAKAKVVIDLDLEKWCDLDRVVINTVRGKEAEVSYPQNVLLFTSSNQKEYTYQGDLMMSENNRAGSFKVQDFALKKRMENVRYVKLVLLSNSKFIFLDELEVFGKNKRDENSVKKDFIKSSRLLRTNQIDQKIKNIKDSTSLVRAKYMELLSLQKFLKGSDTQKNTPTDLATISLQEIKEKRRELRKIKNETQNKKLPKGLTVTKIEDVNNLSRFSLEDIISGAKKNQNNSLKEGYGSKILFYSILNNHQDKQNLSFEMKGKLNLQVYEVLQVASLSKVNLRDALKPLHDLQVTMRQGEHKIFAAVIKTKPGISEGELNIQSLSDHKNLLATPLKIKYVSGVDPSNQLNVNVWAYLDKPVLKSNKEFVINDLEQSHVNTIVVHSAFIDGYETKDFKKLKSYLSQFPNLVTKKILLFRNLRNRKPELFNGRKFLDHNWKNNFKGWYITLQKELMNIGVKKENIYYYPFDEIKPQEVDNFEELNRWAKKAIPNYQSFLTISREDVLSAGNAADLVQLSNFLIDQKDKINTKDTWFYEVLDNSRNRNPYKDYRLMSWEAYFYGLKGIGFWNYCGLPNEKRAKYTNPTINSNEDYSVIYVDKNNSPIPSLRWLYFKKGLEDYKVLKMAEKSIGNEQVKQLVKKVLDDTDNTNLADEIILGLQ